VLIRKTPGWALPDGVATPESVFHQRRTLLKGMAAGSLLAAGSGVLGAAFAAEEGPAPDPSAHLYPVERNTRYQVGRAVTDEYTATHYNNFYEFGSHKKIYLAAQELKIRPWEVAFDGMVEKPFKVGIDELLQKMPLEERVYRFRCVEAWAMTVPWSGFPLAELVKMARPLSGAKYVRMETFHDPEMAKGQKAFWYPWPYVEGLTIEEATNELAFMVTGLYGKPAPRQNGAPLRLQVPWKYGFKSIKSIVRFTFTDERPLSFWEDVQGGEYGFWANVNPEVPHPRWSQATEEVLGTGERVPTLKWNGYGEYVAHLYKGMEDERLFM